MKLKLKESIRANGVQYLPPTVVDTDEIGITQADADVLVRRGTAEVHDEPAPQEAAQSGSGDEVKLDKLKKDELLAMAEKLDIDGATGMNKAELVAAIEAAQSGSGGEGDQGAE